jgi:glycogen debranching enzyme
MNAVKNPILREKILTSSQELLIPGAIRTLANRKVDYPLPITLNGQLLNNPNYPYQGHYCGPEDTSRKVAYHNGTAWVWPFPSYCEALFLEGGKAKLEECISLLHSVTPYLISGVIGHLPEVIDGNYPHKAGGCAAQAWSLSEVYRVNKLLSNSI